MDKITSAGPISDYRNKLRESSLFSPETEITWLPTPARDEYIRRFKINVRLKEPVLP
ncbi:MAG: hypothetical protein M5U15_02720 [Kiritimatiellae bacterium]|nr:hypothetical protein [Kiritimatiellia bacterium]